MAQPQLVISVHEDDQRLLTAAHAAVQDAQRKLCGLAEEARAQYQQRLDEWEECRRSLEDLAELLNTSGNLVEVDSQPDANQEARVGLLEREAQLRERHGELAEKVYRLQRSQRLLNTTIRRLEKEGSRLLREEDGRLATTEDEEQPADCHERILQAHEQERFRLAREIHDGPAQILANAIFEMELFERLVEQDPTALREQLGRLKSDMRDGLSEVRRFIFDLRPLSLDERGFFEALRGYLEAFGKHFGIALEVRLPKSQLRLPSSKEVAIFRIVQEAVQNVQKHAAATRIVVVGKITPAVLELSIEDNGRGFVPEEVASRQSRNLGLISMRERATLIDAQLDIASSPNEGTSISLVVPLGPNTR